jgi:hypothetical protein
MEDLGMRADVDVEAGKRLAYVVVVVGSLENLR